MPLSDHPQFDPTNDRSLFSVLPSWLKEMASAKLTDELVDLTEADLINELFPHKTVPPEWFRLRISFWDEYDRVIRHELMQMDLTVAWRGLVTLPWFIAKANSNPKYLAWILSSPPSYELLLREISELALERQLQVMRLPVVNQDTGKANVRLIEMQLKIFQFIDIRLKGAVVQKIEQKSLNVNVNGNVPKSLPARQLSLAELNEELMRLRKVSEQLMAPVNVRLDEHKLITGEIIEVEVIDEERRQTTAGAKTNAGQARTLAATKADDSIDEKEASSEL